MAELIDGRAVSATVRQRIAAEVKEWVAAGNRPPALATVLVGEDPASQVYVANKRRACEEAGIRSLHHQLDEAMRRRRLDGVAGVHLVVFAHRAPFCVHHRHGPCLVSPPSGRDLRQVGELFG